MVSRRYSRQRELIYQCLAGTTEHPTAEMIYTKLKAEHPNLSLGTVYRNLNLLTEDGKAIKMPFSVERYDANVTPHPHFQCTACGGVYDIMLPYQAALDQAAEAASGHKIEGHSIVFRGVCSHCRGQNN